MIYTVDFTMKYKHGESWKMESVVIKNVIARNRTNAYNKACKLAVKQMKDNNRNNPEIFFMNGMTEQTCLY